MSDFEARIKAVIDDSGVQAQLDKIGSKSVFTIKNVIIDPASLQNSFKNASLSLQNWGKSTGQSIGKQIAGGIASNINTSLQPSAAKNLQSSLLNRRSMDNNAVSEIMKGINKDIDSAQIKVTKLVSTFNSKDLRSYKITGIDELGNTVNIIDTFDKKTGKLINSVTNITQQMSSSASTIDTYKKNLDDLLSTYNKISETKLEIQILTQQGKTNEVKALTDQLNKLKVEFNDKRIAFGIDINSAEVSKKMQEIRDSISISKSKKLDAIKISISSGEAEAGLKNLESQFNRLAQKPPELQQKVSELKRAFAVLNDANSSPADKLAAWEKYSKMLPTVTTEVKKLADEQITLSRSETLSNKIQAWMNDNAKAAEQYGTVLEDLQNKLKDNKDPQMLKEASASFAKIQSEAKAAGLTVSKFGVAVKDAVKQMLGLGSAVAIVQKAVQLFRQMYNEVYEIDKAMTELYKVTDASTSRYDQYLNKAKATSQELGRSLSSYINQTATWSKLGYSISESEDLAKISSIYANVGDVNDETAVSDMVTALKAFNIEASDSITIVDSLNELGNRFATSAGDLGAGLSRSASALHVAGTDMYETLAMLTGGAEITQNADEFGNFLKVASMRLRGMKGELEELGEEIDDDVDSISKVQTQILNLTGGKVNIFDNNGEFRDYYQIMQDIANIYDTLTSTDKASLTEILFGKQRGNQGAALIQAFQSGQIQKAYETAVNSAGSAYREQERWMQSLEAKTQQFKAAWQSLSETVLNSDFLKKAVDTGTLLINVLDKIINALGIIPTILTGIGIAKGIKSVS